MVVFGPRFDTAWQVGLNVLTIGTWVVIVGLFIWSLTRGRDLRPRDLLLIIGFFVAGVYVPLFPLVWLAKERDDSRMPDGSIRWPLGVTRTDAAPRR